MNKAIGNFRSHKNIKKTKLKGLQMKNAIFKIKY